MLDKKGGTHMFAMLVVALGVFYVINYIFSITVQSETAVSDIPRGMYKTFNSIEFAKLNANQAFKFSVKKTLKDMNISDISTIASDDQLKNQFLQNLTNNFKPSLSFSEVSVSVGVKSLDVRNNNIIAEMNMSSVAPGKQVETSYTLTYPI